MAKLMYLPGNRRAALSKRTGLCGSWVGVLCRRYLRFDWKGFRRRDLAGRERNTHAIVRLAHVRSFRQ